MSTPDERWIAEYYDGLVRKHGHAPRACDYGRDASQRAKFRAISALLPKNATTLLDVGCGFADFATHLRSCHPHIQYHGVDLSAQMVAAARESQPGVSIRRMGVREVSANRERFDVVTANGIFYLVRHRPAEVMRETISIMFEMASMAVVFNSLSTLGGAEVAGEYRASPFEMLEFCATKTPYVALSHQHLAHDFTISMYRSPEEL